MVAPGAQGFNPPLTWTGVKGLGALAIGFLLAGCTSIEGSRPSPSLAPPIERPAIDGHDVLDYEWTPRAPGPTPRTEVVVGQVGSKFYVIGGFATPAAPGAIVPTNMVEIYDAATDRWSRGPDYPLQIHHASAGELNGFLYVAGGLVGPAFTATNLAYRLDAARDLWAPIQPMPFPRGAYGAGVVQGKLFVAGGVDVEPGSHTPETHAFDPDRGSWARYNRAVPTPRDHVGGAGMGGRLYLVGGDVRGHEKNTNANEAFEPRNFTWMKFAPLPTPRGSLTLVNWRDHLVAIGGQNGTQTFATVEAYNPSTDNWTALAPLHEARHGFGAGVWNDDLYVIYGGPGPGLTVTGSVERLALR